MSRSASVESFWIESLLSLVEPFAPPPLDKLATRVATQIGLAKAMRKYDLRGLHHVPLVRGESRTLRGCDTVGFVTRSDPAPDALNAAIGNALGETHLRPHTCRPASHPPSAD